MHPNVFNCHLVIEPNYHKGKWGNCLGFLLLRDSKAPKTSTLKIFLVPFPLNKYELMLKRYREGFQLKLCTRSPTVVYRSMLTNNNNNNPIYRFIFFA